MYKVLLVDDESFVLEGLKRRVHWQDLNLEIVGTASDGLEAIRKIEQLQPDILVTDIIMPIMDGIKLIETIRELDLSVKIIILSGHDEFTYAQKAIRLGAVEYQLKPVSIEEIESTLKTTIEQLEIEKASQKRNSEMEKSSKQQAQMMKQYMLTDLATGKADHWERLIYEVGKIDPASLNGQFLVSLMSIDPMLELPEPLSQKDADLTVFLALNITNEIIGSNQTNFAVKLDDNQIVLFTFFPNDWSAKQIQTSIQWMFNLVQENIRQYLQHNATIAIGSVVQKIADLH
jgi:two-component system response regulator YesN